jgi:hypothetical protein
MAGADLLTRRPNFARSWKIKEGKFDDRRQRDQLSAIKQFGLDASQLVAGARYQRYLPISEGWIPRTSVAFRSQTIC